MTGVLLVAVVHGLEGGGRLVPLAVLQLGDLPLHHWAAAYVIGALGLGLEEVGLLGPGLVVLDALCLGLEDVGLLGPGLVLGALGIGLEEVGLLGPGLVVLDAFGLGLVDVSLLGPASYFAPSVSDCRKSVCLVPAS